MSRDIHNYEAGKCCKSCVSFRLDFRFGMGGKVLEGWDEKCVFHEKTVDEWGWCPAYARVVKWETMEASQ